MLLILNQHSLPGASFSGPWINTIGLGVQYTSSNIQEVQVDILCVLKGRWGTDFTPLLIWTGMPQKWKGCIWADFLLIEIIEIIKGITRCETIRNNCYEHYYVLINHNFWKEYSQDFCFHNERTFGLLEKSDITYIWIAFIVC